MQKLVPSLSFRGSFPPQKDKPQVDEEKSNLENKNAISDPLRFSDNLIKENPQEVESLKDSFLKNNNLEMEVDQYATEFERFQKELKEKQNQLENLDENLRSITYEIKLMNQVLPKKNEGMDSITKEIEVFNQEMNSLANDLQQQLDELNRQEEKTKEQNNEKQKKMQAELEQIKQSSSDLQSEIDKLSRSQDSEITKKTIQDEDERNQIQDDSNSLFKFSSELVHNILGENIQQNQFNPNYLAHYLSLIQNEYNKKQLRCDQIKQSLKVHKAFVETLENKEKELEENIKELKKK
ncbi:a-type inclusion protein [Anaeramoeba ignava]|uniref:A-type inclusion protein n=1 Tax=Anaeramoeba ignava TaxID=1746090 RepID=A0A9Q0LWL9_ANAIG|nr:a-type inclusion protein [Anaeramoeba ignava]